MQFWASEGLLYNIQRIKTMCYNNFFVANIHL